MNEEKVSVIVPVYNVEKYVLDCLRSISGQTYRDIEILIIDDGSTDGSGEICDRFIDEDVRVRVIHQNNMGLSGARNRGLKESTGRYVTFVDSDDVISPFFVEYLYKAIDECDISACDFEYVDESYLLPEQEDAPADIKTIKLSNTESIKEVYGSSYHGIDFIACSKLYKKELFIDNSIEFPVGKLHEDTFTTYKLLYFSKKTAYVDIPLYRYRQRSGSITRSSFDKRRLACIEATRGECEFFEERNELELLSLSFNDHLHKTKNLIRDMLIDEKDYTEEIRKTCDGLKKDLKKYSKRIRISIKKRIRYGLMTYWPRIAK